MHTALTVATASGVIAPYAIVQLDGNPYLYVAGCLVGVLVGPDMDVDGGNISDFFIRKVSRLAQHVWRLIWFPYAVLVPHRHFISHFPVISTLLRIGYIFLIINLSVALFRIAFNIELDKPFYWIWDWSFFFGLVHVDTVHFVVDKLIKGKETMEI